MEKRNTERPFSKDQERHLLRLAKKLFMEHHPNPQRIGCPGEEMLKGVAYGSEDLPRAQQEAVMEHLSICSPCFRQFYSYRRGVRFRHQVPILLGVAALVIVAGVLAYDYLGRTRTSPEQQFAREPRATQEYQRASLDLRGHATVRSSSPRPAPPGGATLALPRGPLVLTIVLPVGSDEGTYSIRLGQSGEEAALEASGRSEIKDGTTSLQVQIDTSDYVLGVRKEPWAWTEYAVQLR
jgi:hypothetical protein